MPAVHLLTCPWRAEGCAQTLGRWARTDWPVPPTVHLDSAPADPAWPWGDPARAERIADAFAGMLQLALDEPGESTDWVLFLEDDLDFHHRLAMRVREWTALDDIFCCVASLFNPSVRPVVTPRAPPHAFAAVPESFQDDQALLLRRGAIRQLLAEWDRLTGLPAQRVAGLLGRGGPIWVHQPSLVLPVAKDSSWRTGIQRALDFDPDWEPQRGSQTTQSPDFQAPSLPG